MNNNKALNKIQMKVKIQILRNDEQKSIIFNVYSFNFKRIIIFLIYF
jgi:hypothetical protein